MVVAGEARAWAPTRAPLVFDTTFVHAAYNDHDDEPADYVHVDFWHPELADEECAALALFDECRARWKAARARLRHERAALLRPYCAGLPMAPPQQELESDSRP